MPKDDPNEPPSTPTPTPALPPEGASSLTSRGGEGWGRREHTLLSASKKNKKPKFHLGFGLGYHW